MSGIGYPKNRLITIEILRSSDIHVDGSETHIYFNARIKSDDSVTERQRMNFYKKKNKLGSASNTCIASILEVLVKYLRTDSTISIEEKRRLL